MTGPRLVHRSFVIERRLPGNPAHAFRFWSDPALKRRWTGCHPDWQVLEDDFDFRLGGGERTRWCLPDGTEQAMTAHYLDIAAPHRLVYAYTMRSNGHPVSASLVTIEFTAAGPATTMTFTEQAAFATEAAATTRETGTAGSFDRLAEVMTEAPAGM